MLKSSCQPPQPSLCKTTIHLCCLDISINPSPFLRASKYKLHLRHSGNSTLHFDLPSQSFESSTWAPTSPKHLCPTRSSLSSAFAPWRSKNKLRTISTSTRRQSPDHQSLASRHHGPQSPSAKSESGSISSCKILRTGRPSHHPQCNAS